MRTLQSPGAALPGRMGEEIRALAPWFHNLHLPDGIQTAPDHPLGDFPRFKWEQIGKHLPEDLAGARALDIGCNAGFYSFELARRGADVLGVDVSPHYLRQAEWARDRFGLGHRVRFERRTVYELATLRESFDVVLFLGVFYHLRHPLLALEIVAEKVDRLLVFQTLSLPETTVIAAPEDVALEDRERLEEPGWPRMAFVERELAGDPTNWWIPNRACCEAMLRSVGFSVEGQPAQEIYLCRPDPARSRDSELDDLRAALCGSRETRQGAPA